MCIPHVYSLGLARFSAGLGGSAPPKSRLELYLTLVSVLQLRNQGQMGSSSLNLGGETGRTMMVRDQSPVTCL